MDTNKDNITGRDDFIISQALAFAIEAIDTLPNNRRPLSNRGDMIRLLEHFTKQPKFHRTSARLTLSQATPEEAAEAFNAEPVLFLDEQYQAYCDRNA